MNGALRSDTRYLAFGLGYMSKPHAEKATNIPFFFPTLEAHELKLDVAETERGLSHPSIIIMPRSS
jgi:hypothetical protein